MLRLLCTQRKFPISLPDRRQAASPPHAAPAAFTCRRLKSASQRACWSTNAGVAHSDSNAHHLQASERGKFPIATLRNHIAVPFGSPRQSFPNLFGLIAGGRACSRVKGRQTQPHQRGSKLKECLTSEAARGLCRLNKSTCRHIWLLG